MIDRKFVAGALNIAAMEFDSWAAGYTEDGRLAKAKAMEARAREARKLFKRLTSRRERRRARKAAKNRYMYEKFGRRPWARENGRAIYAYGRGDRFPCKTYDNLYRPHYRLYVPSTGRVKILARDREPSGFVSMSRVADGLRK